MNPESEFEPMLANRGEIVSIRNFDKDFNNNNKINYNINEEKVLIESEDCPQSSLELIWNNICFTVNEREIKTLSGIPYNVVNKKKIILENQCGRFTSAKLTGILGPNGAGKTTLLECLGGLRKEGFSGEVFIRNNG